MSHAWPSRLVEQPDQTAFQIVDSQAAPQNHPGGQGSLDGELASPVLAAQRFR